MAEVDTAQIRDLYGESLPGWCVEAMCDEIDDLRARLARQHEHLLAEAARRYKAEDCLAAVLALCDNADASIEGVYVRSDRIRATAAGDDR